NLKLLYNVFRTQLTSSAPKSQQMLFPHTIELPPKNAQTLIGELGFLRKAGIDIGHFGGNSFVIQGMPEGCENVNFTELIEGFIEDLQEGRPGDDGQMLELVARSL